MADDAKLDLVRAAVAGHMDDILALWKPGAKIAVLVLVPDKPDADFMMTNGEPADMVALIERRIAAGG